MRLQQVVIDHVRNLHNINIKLSEHINIFVGANASGKTSFLESLHLLAYAKSFRSHHFKHIVNHDAKFLRVTGRIVEPGRQQIHLGIEFRDGRLRMRAEGRSLKKTSDLAQYLPIIIIHQECQRLLSDGPKRRRKFLDWGVFHVEQDFLKVWRRYMRALKQRNISLHARRGRAAVAAWDQELADNAVAIHAFRQSYCDQFFPILQTSLDSLMGGHVEINLAYKPGWDTQQGFLGVLKAAYDQDARRGFTHQGPHRADLLILSGGVSVQESLSGGQQKLLVAAMLISQALVYRQRSGKPCIFLVDDLKAELDQHHVEKVMMLLQGLDAQIILTTTEKDALSAFCVNGYKTFHVERGRVTEVV